MIFRGAGLLLFAQHFAIAIDERHYPMKIPRHKRRRVYEFEIHMAGYVGKSETWVRALLKQRHFSDNAVNRTSETAALRRRYGKLSTHEEAVDENRAYRNSVLAPVAHRRSPTARAPLGESNV
jgi:hypothetical protein